jgi:hypothetical protein
VSLPTAMSILNEIDVEEEKFRTIANNGLE